jgi:hypothetical protein
MKNFLLLLALLLPSSLLSQTFSFVRTDPPVVYDTLGILEIKNHGVVTNLTSNSFSITFRATYNLPSGWFAGYCSWRACYPPMLDSATADSLRPGPNDFYVYFNPDTISPSTGYVTVTAKKTSNPSEQYTVIFGAGTYPVGIKQLSNIVKEFSLSQNYPNPFNPSTKINFSVPAGDYVDLRVYDILGREVKVLLSQYVTAGEYEIDFDAHNLASGMYYYRLKSRDNVAVKKMTLVK